MKFVLPLVLALAGSAFSQFPSLSWGGSSRPGPLGYGKPGPMSPFTGGGGGYPPPPRGERPFDDPIPPLDSEQTYDSQKLPSELPILAPNGVVEIYNRVVDDLLRKLAIDLKDKEMDPMPVVVRSTPPGPVRVPGYLQKRPFRRPGAALYRAVDDLDAPLANRRRRARSGVLPPETRFSNLRGEEEDDEAEPSYRGAGKISKEPLIADTLVDDEVEDMEKKAKKTTKKDSALMSEESLFFSKARSEELFPFSDEEDYEDSEEVRIGEPVKKESKKENKQDAPSSVETLALKYQSKNSKGSSSSSSSKGNKKKSNKKKTNSKPTVIDPFQDEKEEYGYTLDKGPVAELGIKKNDKKAKSSEEDDKRQRYGEIELSQSSEEDEDESVSRDDLPEDDYGYEPGTGGNERPQGGYYPLNGPPVVPRKPNADLSGLSRMRRASDVAVRVDARSAVVTARLLVGPLIVHINESTEPLEENVRATIPELEAEVVLMERHGVVFLKRFTLDRAYGQDVEISIPKKNKKKVSYADGPNNPSDPNHPANVESRRQTKMAAHISMEVVKLLRSGNLRVNLVRTAQNAMSRLSLPIKKPKKKSSSKKTKRKKKNKSKGLKKASKGSKGTNKA